MSTSTGPSSSSAVVRERRKRPWWIWAALAAVALLLLLLGLTQCVGGNPRPGAEGTAPGAAPSAAPQGGATAPAAGAPGAGGLGTGTLTADGAALLPVAGAADAGGSLAGLVGKGVTGEAVSVQSVPANEGFWVGTSDTDRVWVQLTGQDESGYKVQPGDRVSFVGAVVAHDPTFAGTVGVDAAEGADQLTREAAHVEVAKAALRKS